MESVQYDIRDTILLAPTYTEKRNYKIKFPPAEDVSAEDAANDVAQVGDIVDVRQGTGHKHVSLALLWQTEKKTDLDFNLQSKNCSSPPRSPLLLSC